MQNKTFSVNAQIKSHRVILIGSEGQKLGEFLTTDALRMAQSEGMDLVQVGSEKEQPICKVMDYGRYQYLQKKKGKKNSSQNNVKTKEIVLRPNSDVHDVNIKVRQAAKFLQKGNKVKITISFRGREGAHMSLIKERCRNIAQKLSEISDIESDVKASNRSVSAILCPKKV